LEFSTKAAKKKPRTETKLPAKDDEVQLKSRDDLGADADADTGTRKKSKKK
jgi:hypothetical protein